MKWKEWVDKVETRMKEAGIEENPELYFVDTTPNETRIALEEDGNGIIVTSF
jgi:hypothetical protein